ncbi:polyprenyl synthetase family protein [Helicobacter sp. WB40]|uniref:polyprenyl synthetase family protein n=1 Tax=Helicobacter sp. WB40 TaxID=3004130 RepID=UPI0022EBE937|nr:polyprenyl synthetase family protein [Helicobacter sp. WB40]MDA3967470.1 polyprenyl synthetase family protein [Helicobacter sp. WB40]
MKTLLQNTLDDFESFIALNAPKIESFHPYYESALWEMVLGGGKRFRPQLLMTIVLAYAPHKIQCAFLPALALEVLHTYSLIHDDLPSMDNASLRRGLKTLHTKYDEAGAILIGDALNTYAFYLLSQAKLKPKTKIKLVKILSKNGGIYGMVLGQALDCYFEEKKLPLSSLKTIHINKTAKLISASLQMGGAIANVDKKTLKTLKKLGILLGLFFQIRDDIIDSTQSEKEALKTTNNDTNKNSYVNLLGLEGARYELEKLKTKIDSKIKKLNTNSQEILNIILKKYLKEV